MVTVKPVYRFLTLAFLLALCLRFLFFVVVLDSGGKSWLMVDSEQYHRLALAFKQADWLHSLSFLRLPGYSVFLAVFGSYALYIQLLLASFLPIPMYVFTRVLWPQDFLLARLVCLFSVVHVGFILYAGMFATESLCLLFLLLFFIYFFRLMQDQSSSMHDAAYAGIFLGLLSLIRPVGHYMLIVSLVILLLSKSQQRVKTSLMFTASWLIIAGIWLLRNFLLTGHLFFHTLPGQHFLQYSAAYVHQEQYGRTYIDARRALMGKYDQAIKQETLAGGRRLHAIEECKIAEGIAFQELRTHPWCALKHSLKHIMKALLAPQTQLLPYLYEGWFSYDEKTGVIDKIKRFVNPTIAYAPVRWLMRVDLLSHIFLLLGTLLFFIRAFIRREQLSIALSMLAFMAFFMFITLAYGSARLRLPIEPLMIMCALKFWVGWWRGI